MEKHLKCPNCGRNPAEDEMYCYFCETGMQEMEKKKAKQPDKKHK